MVGQEAIVSVKEVRAIIASFFERDFSFHPACKIKTIQTDGGAVLRLDVQFTRCWTYQKQVFESRFGHVPDATSNYDWMGVSLRENRHSFVISAEVVCDSSDNRYKVRLTFYWRPVYSLLGLLKAHFNGPWYLFPWRLLTVIGMDFRTGLRSETMSMGQFDNHLAAFDAVRVPIFDTMPADLREMLNL